MFGFSPVEFYLQIFEEKLMVNLVPNFQILGINT